MLQRVTNTVLQSDGKVLLLQKPSRHWWVAPGGKMEPGESIIESAKREFREETGLHIKDPNLRAVFTMVMMKDQKVVNEWMMFTFHATDYEGQLLKESPEGKLSWKQEHEVQQLTMAEGDLCMFEHVLQRQGVLYGTFYYTEEFELISHRLTPDFT
ncbi:8-oxo-dGTP diphosphatase [Halalkalibacter hemicellulosilyticus]|uniref:8-oxo-dGTP diphosphatase n=1 Tax=Halalkalibacter hemicellulosilyticus TaxID=127886 RepID=UPI0009E03F88|nr:8-oxo-dGTP diphosphatase [Halalkalibacter hemicellulosilyticus]